MAPVSTACMAASDRSDVLWVNESTVMVAVLARGVPRLALTDVTSKKTTNRIKLNELIK